jgi:hypothetical protein
VEAEMSTELSGNVGFFNGRSEVNMAHIRGEYAELVVEASTTERLMAKRSTGPKGVRSLLGFTCGPSEYTLYNFHVQVRNPGPREFQVIGSLDLCKHSHIRVG